MLCVVAMHQRGHATRCVLRHELAGFGCSLATALHSAWARFVAQVLRGELFGVRPHLGRTVNSELWYSLYPIIHHTHQPEPSPQHPVAGTSLLLVACALWPPNEQARLFVARC